MPCRQDRTGGWLAGGRFINMGRLGKRRRHHLWKGATPVASLSPQSWCSSSAANDDDIRYGLAGRRWDRRTGEGGCRASARGMLRPRIPTCYVMRSTPSRGTFLIKEPNQVPKYGRTGCRSWGRTIKLRLRRRSSGTLSFFSLPVDFFLISLISRLRALSMPIDWMSDLHEAHAILVATR